MNLLSTLNFPLVCLFKRLLFCSLQPKDGFRLSRNIDSNLDELQNLRISMLLLRGFSNEAKVYFRQLEKKAKILIRVEERVQFNAQGAACNYCNK